MIPKKFSKFVGIFHVALCLSFAIDGLGGNASAGGLQEQPLELAGWTITIDAAAKQGPSRVENFMFVQGAPLEAGDEQGSNEQSRKFEVAAWKGLDLISESVTLFDDGDPGQGIRVVRVTRGRASPPPNGIGPLGPKKDLYLDTRDFDVMQQYWRETFGGEGFRRIFGAAHMPRVLSSNPSAADYQTYPPADYAEWRAVLEAAVRYLNRIGVDDPYLMLFGEPESADYFNVLSPDGTPYPIATEPVLREYVRLYGESQRAVKAADSGAKVSAMCAGVYGSDLFRDLRQAPEQKGLDDFIAYVAEYNATLPPGVPRAELDNICWQGYSWRGEKRLMPMARHIQAVLTQYGFDPSTPQYLSGWSGGWASPRPAGRSYPIHLYAPHLVYNVIEQLNPGGQAGPIAQAHYYTWNLDGFYGDDGVQENSSLVRTVHNRIIYDPVTGHAASNRNCLRPAYIAFQALKALEKGEILAMKERRPLLVRSMATADSTGIRVLLVNYTSGPQRVRLTIEHMPAAGIKEAVIRRVPRDEVCGDGNWFPVNDPLSTFSNEPARLTAAGAGTFTASISLVANTVALLDIPLRASQ